MRKRAAAVILPLAYLLTSGLLLPALASPITCGSQEHVDWSVDCSKENELIPCRCSDWITWDVPTGTVDHYIVQRWQKDQDWPSALGCMLAVTENMANAWQMPCRVNDWTEYVFMVRAVDAEGNFSPDFSNPVYWVAYPRTCVDSETGLLGACE